jgi:glycosyltransferase involved in cell wall biosynthesis
MSEPITVYTVLPDRHTASFYYRLQVPLKTAAELGLPVLAMIDHNSADQPAMDRARAFCEADLILLYQPIGEAPIQNIKGIQGFIPSKREGQWKWPPTVVVETDDNLFNVSPLNQAYKGLGTRDMNGKELPQGQHIGVVRGGERQILWADGEKGFDLAKNRQTLGSYRTILEMVDAVQCSTPAVAECVTKEVTPRRLRTFPNLVRFNDYEQVALQDDPKQIRILWQGGSAHYEDWWPLRQQVANITRKYPEVHWIIWGVLYHWVMQEVPAERYTYIDWCPYQEYRLRLAMQGHDIALAPLTENVFNRCRSAIKFYEASPLHKPAAVLAQNSGAYRDEILDGETALLFNNPQEFEDKLSLLIEDAKLRKTLAANAKDWVSENRDAHKRVPEIVRFWEELREERKLEQPHVTDQEWDRIEAEAAEEENQNGVPDGALQTV